MDGGDINWKRINNAANRLHFDKPYLLFSCGSRTSLKCTRVSIDGNGHVNSCLLAEIGTPINSLKSKSKRSDWSDTNDVRFLSMAVIPMDAATGVVDLYCIPVACSDGYIRYLDFSSFSLTLKNFFAALFRQN